MRREVVRGIGYKALHYVEAPDALFSNWEMNGAPFEGVEKPVVGKCGKLIRSSQPVAAVVPQALPTCPGCFETFVADAQEYRKEEEG